MVKYGGNDMDKIILDGLKIKTKEDLFDTIRNQLDSSEFYSNNLDALYDVLSTINVDLFITIKNYKHLKKNLGEYANNLETLLIDLTNENDNVKYEISK